MKHWLIGLFMGILALVAVSPASAQSDGFTPSECPEYGLADYSLTCGYVSVPADHTAPSDARFEIAVVIVHRTGVDAVPDPLVYVNGGPGGKTLASLPFYVAWFEPYLQDRDVIFFDARGIGTSKPTLECPGLDAAFLQSAEMQPTDARSTILAAAGACYDDLAAAGIDPNLFNSAQIAGDLSVMREALGYEEWNLYGLSYGSRHVMTALRDYPDGIRSAIVDAAVTPEANLLSDAPANAERAIQRLSDECHRDWLCRTAYPDILGTFHRVIDRLDVEPATLTLELEDGTIEIATLDGVGFRDRVIGMLSSAKMVPSIPAVIYNADHGDFTTLAEMQTAIAEARKAGGSAMPSTHGQAFSVICAEEAPFNQAPASSSVTLSDFCSVWPIEPLGAVENQPVSSDVPTLFGMGSFDSLLTPAYARAAAEHFEHGYVVEAAGQAHGIFNQRGCGSAVGRAFLSDPTTTPDSSCFTLSDTPHWVITIDVSRPVSRVLSILLLIAGGVVLTYGSALLVEMARGRRIAWQATFRRIGWWPLAMSIALAIVLNLAADAIRLDIPPAMLLAVAVSLSSAVQVVLAMASSDEPALEILLALPQPYSRIKLSQIALVLLMQAALALLGTILIVLIDEANPGEALLMWLAPMLFLSGVAALLTMRTQHTALAAMMVIMASLGIAVAGEQLLPVKPMQLPWDMPAAAVQPFAWIILPFLQPDSLTGGAFLSNRIVVSGLGILMLAWALMMTANSEKMLMTHKSGN